ncbi:helix-turn-helix domain-containing protein, partial [Staphylococcus aureus]|uniref:helix-turn-helix domain-containing protein n=1 Tax=Staphylococcus aureus TaxID=1280 RepID=UPI00359CB742
MTYGISTRTKNRQTPVTQQEPSMRPAQANGWHKEDIKAAIRKRGITMNELARERGLPPSTVRNALARP